MVLTQKILDCQTNLKKYFIKIVRLSEGKLAFKTGLAASLSLVIGTAFTSLFDRPEIMVSGLWCVMASIVVMYSNLGGTYSAAWIRFLGVLLGSITGVIFIQFFDRSPISLACGVFFTIVLCSLLSLKESFRIAALSTAIIILIGDLHTIASPWHFAFYRFIDSCIGIFIAVSVARIVLPEKATEYIKNDVGNTLHFLQKYYILSTSLHNFNEIDLKASVCSIARIDELFQIMEESSREADFERYDTDVTKEYWIPIIEQLDVIYNAIKSIRLVDKDTLLKIFDKDLSSKVSNVIIKTDEAFDVLQKNILDDSKGVSFSFLISALNELNQDLSRFRMTSTTREFSIENVESFYVFLYSLRSIVESIAKIERQVLYPRELIHK